MNGYNLTSSQKNLLRTMVEVIRSGKASEPFLGIGTRSGYSLHPWKGGDPIELEGGNPGELDALVEADLLSARLNSKGTEYLYSIKQAGYDAVDSDFNAPDTSFVIHLSPLADVTNLDQQLKDRCLPILGAGSADPKLWDSAIRTAGVILEERMRDVGTISNHEKVGRDLVNDIFGQNGSLSSKFKTDSDRQGYRDLYAGIVGVIRNPYAHRLIDPSPEDGGVYIVTVNLLLKLLEDLR